MAAAYTFKLAKRLNFTKGMALPSGRLSGSLGNAREIGRANARRR
jgi:hypothetical protein